MHTKHIYPLAGCNVNIDLFVLNSIILLAFCTLLVMSVLSCEVCTKKFNVTSILKVVIYASVTVL